MGGCTQDMPDLLYWKICADKGSDRHIRLLMYFIPFTILGGNEELEGTFLDGAKKHKLYTLAGHRSVRGCCASLYKWMPSVGVQQT